MQVGQTTISVTNNSNKNSDFFFYSLKTDFLLAFPSLKGIDFESRD